MKKYFLFLLTLPLISKAQLTVEQIMRDPKWIGTSPSEIFWSYDSKAINFKWNPEKNTSDSSYKYDMVNNKIEKVTYIDANLAEDISNGKYNTAKTKIAFVHNGDVYVLTIATKTFQRITQTVAEESNAYFLANNAIVVYQSGNDVYAFNTINGSTQQLTHFENEIGRAHV